MKQQFFIIAGLIFLSFSTIKAEQIDGPANIRMAPDKQAIFSLLDNVDVECTQPKQNWYQIKITVRITADQYNKQLSIKKGEKLIDMNGKIIGEALVDIPEMATSAWSSGSGTGNSQTYGMDLFGFTAKGNIRLNSIPENQLIDIIIQNKTHLTKVVLDDYIKHFSFEKGGLLNTFYPSLTEYMIYENSIDDPSPLDRLRFVFENNMLIAIVHSRSLPIPNAEQVEVDRGRTLTIFKVPAKTDKKTFIQKNKEAYQGVD